MGTRVAYLITDVQREDDGEDARVRVPPVALQPAVEDVLDEGRVVDQDLREEDAALREPLQRTPSTCEVPPAVVALGDGAVHPHTFIKNLLHAQYWGEH